MIDLNDNKKDIEDWAPEPFTIPDYWLNVNFEDLFDILSINGLKIPQSDYLLQGDFPIIDQGAELIGGYTNNASSVLKNDGGVIVFGDHTRCLKLISFDFAPGADGIKVLKPRSGLNLKYLFYVCKALKLPNRGYSRHFAFLKKSQIPLPSINEQERIVAKIEELFSELDNGIKSLNTAREQLKVYRQAILKHAFEGKLTAAWREKNKDSLESSDQLLRRIIKERNDYYKQQLTESEAASKIDKKKPKLRTLQPISEFTPEELAKLPGLPDSWIWLKYGDLCSIVRNGISQKPEGIEGTKIFRISAVRPMEFVIDDIRYIDNSREQYTAYFLQKGDLVFTRYNGTRSYVGVCAEYKSDGTHLFPDKLIQTRLATTSILSGYLEKAINCGVSRKFIESFIRTTAGQSGISGSDIKAMPVPICNMDEQSIINDYVTEELSRISRLLDEIEDNLLKSEALRQSILKKAFSGKLVAQDPNDEPASTLLERIRFEKTTSQTHNKNNQDYKVEPVNEYTQGFLISETAL